MFELTQPLTIPMPKNEHLLLDDWVYHYTFEGRLFALVLRRGFISDLASVPRVLWTLIGLTSDGLHRGAALAHDMLYRHEGQMPMGSLYVWDQDQWVEEVINQSRAWSRRDSDALFSRIMRDAGVSMVDRRLMYRGVRLGGWLSWMRPYRPKTDYAKVCSILRAYGRVIPQYLIPPPPLDPLKRSNLRW